MPLWDRFTRMVKSNVGRFLDDPTDQSGASRRLQQRMKELRARDGELKQLDEQIITLKGNATFLERKLEKLRRREAELEAKAKSATAHGAGMVATNHEIDLTDARRETAMAEAELSSTRLAVERAEAAKRALVEEKATRLAAAQEALLEAELGPGAVAEREAERVAAERSAPPATRTPSAGAPLIKVSPRGAPPPAEAEPSAPQKTIGPGVASAASPAAAQSSEESGRSKTVGPGEDLLLKPTGAALGDPPAAASPVKSLGPAPTPPAGTVTAHTPVASEPHVPPGPASAPARGDQLLDELERLGKLLEAGAITPDEFAAAKKKLLG